MHAARCFIGSWCSGYLVTMQLSFLSFEDRKFAKYLYFMAGCYCQDLENIALLIVLKFCEMRGEEHYQAIFS